MLTQLPASVATPGKNFARRRQGDAVRLTKGDLNNGLLWDLQRQWSGRPVFGASIAQLAAKETFRI